MFRRPCLILAVVAVGFWGLADTLPANAGPPSVDPAARQKFVALLTSVPAKVKKATARQGSLRAFAARAPSTVVNLPY